MNKIRIIDLIANGEEVPEKIFYDNENWINRYPNDYEGLDRGGCLLNNVCLNELNDEVEIIEEDKKIEKLPIWATRREDKEYTNLEEHILVVAQKVDELIDKVNSLENNK